MHSDVARGFSRASLSIRCTASAYCARSVVALLVRLPYDGDSVRLESLGGGAPLASKTLFAAAAAMNLLFLTLPSLVTHERQPQQRYQQ